jgi:hypothetical protein
MKITTYSFRTPYPGPWRADWCKKNRGQRQSGCIFYYAETIPSNVSPLYPEKEGRRLYIRMPFLLVLRGQFMKRWSAVRSTTVHTPKSNRRHRVVVAIIHRSKIFPGKVGYVLQYALPVTPRGVSLAHERQVGPVLRMHQSLCWIYIPTRHFAA